jgi:hypothetical protein
MRIAAALLLACALLAGCGGGSQSSTAPNPSPAEGAPKKAIAPNAPAGSRVVSCKVAGGPITGLRATAIDCGTARAMMRRWARERACTTGVGSRGSCSLGSFRCQAVRSGRGAVVSCARPGADVTFLARSWLLKGSGG